MRASSRDLSVPVIGTVQRSRTDRAQFAKRLRLLETGLDRLARVGGYLAAGGMIAMPLLITADILLRYFGLGSLPWATDISEYILYVSTFLGAPWVLRLAGHVRVDILLTALSAHVARRLEQTMSLFAAGVCLLLSWYGCLATAEAWEQGTKQYKALIVADWPFRAIFTFCMVVLAIEFLLRLGRAATALDPTTPGRAVGG